jgi:hypothetical protein
MTSTTSTATGSQVAAEAVGPGDWGLPFSCGRSAGIH